MDNVTILIPTSPIPSHPSTHFIDECIISIRQYLPSQIIIMADGVRKEQTSYRPAYIEYLNTLKGKYENTTLAVFDKHMHQARMTREAIQHVTTPTILFIEHDMALRGEIPFDTMITMLKEEKADTIRLLYEDNDLINFSYMLRKQVGDFTQTMQWSNRPHLARTAYYEQILAKYFSSESKTFIEDRMHGVIDSEANWNAHKLWIYTPPPPVNRFKINDGREGAPKYDEDLIY